MPDLNIRNIDASLLRSVNIEAARADKTQRDWVLGVLAQAVHWEAKDDAEEITRSLPTHNPKECRVYRCSQCIAAGKKF